MPQSHEELRAAGRLGGLRQAANARAAGRDPTAHARAAFQAQLRDKARASLPPDATEEQVEKQYQHLRRAQLAEASLALAESRTRKRQRKLAANKRNAGVTAKAADTGAER